MKLKIGQHLNLTLFLTQQVHLLSFYILLLNFFHLHGFLPAVGHKLRNNIFFKFLGMHVGMHGVMENQ